MQHDLLQTPLCALASHAGIFRGARISSLPTKRGRLFVPRLKLSLSVVAKHIENRNLHYPVIFLSFPRSQRVKLHMSQMFGRAVGSAAFKS